VEFEEIDLAANKEARDIVIAKTGNEVIKSGLANRVSFGVLFLANPDLPDRFGKNALLNSADPLTFYTGEEKGYTDYPALGAGTPEKL
jgi:2,4-dienoyl-CoA reductase-like NADH-dependent reductase (Old Yellow Enzyme family)